MSQQAANRFGHDGPTRIGIAATVYTEASEVMPYEPGYVQSVGFLPASLVDAGGAVTGTSLTSGDSDDWKAYPGKLDLHYWRGDDVVLTLNVSDPEQPDLDLSVDSGCEWIGQVRAYHDHHAPLLYQFSVATEFTPRDEEDDDSLAVTEVKLLLPAGINTYQGAFSWDLQVTAPEDFSDWGDSKPEGVDEADWPPTDRTTTFVYGNVYVVAEVSRSTPSMAMADPVVRWWPNGRVP